MKNMKFWRTALVATLVLTVMLSVTGGTIAWFTDEVTSASNVIKSGNLDVEVEYTLDGENWKNLDGADDLFKKGLWEPGHTEVVALKIKNKGSLALKYNANMNIVNEEIGKTKAGADIKLSDILDVSTLTIEAAGVDPVFGIDIAATTLEKAFQGENEIAWGDPVDFNAGNVLESEQQLFVGTTQYVFIKVDMAETVGNEANHNGTDIPSIEFGIEVEATQYTHEDDSFGNQYDKDAPYFKVNDLSELDAAIAAGESKIQLAAGTYDKFPASSLKEGVTLKCEEGTVFEGKSGLNINGATVVGATFSNDSGNAVSGTINGTIKDCTFTGSNALRGCYAGETVVFENCVFDGSVYGIHFDGGANAVTFKNCTFSGFNAMGAAITKLTMEGCTFKANGKSGYNGINLWGDTEMKDCTFVFDGTADTEWVDVVHDNKTVTFTNCVVTDGVNTKSVADVVGDYGEGNTIIVDGVTLTK